jgi:hypothetical protein
MQAPWTKTLKKITVWLACEVCLNLVGLDTLIDYAEFLFDSHRVTIVAIAPQIGQHKAELFLRYA